MIGKPAYAIVSKGLALSPEGWRLFVGQTVEQNLRLGATALADRSRIGALLERVYALFPRLAERRRQRAGTLVRRRAADAGARPRVDERAETADARRAEPWPCARHRRTALRHAQGAARDGLTLLLAEQSVPLALGIADYAYVLQTGRIVLEGPARGARAQRSAGAGDLSRHEHKRRSNGAVTRPYCSHSASRRWRNAFGRSANRRTAMRAARCASCAERSAQAGVSRERQCARI